MNQSSPFLAEVTAALTFVLILVTGFYAWANYRVMRIMQADVRARTEPIPRLGVDFRAPGIVTVQVRVEHAPMRLILLNLLLIATSRSTTWAECEIGDPRTISPETPANFSVTYKLRGNPQEWTALIHYTDLGEALEYHMKLNSKGFSLVQSHIPPGPISRFFKGIGDKFNEAVNEMDRSVNEHTEG